MVVMPSFRNASLTPMLPPFFCCDPWLESKESVWMTPLWVRPLQEQRAKTKVFLARSPVHSFSLGKKRGPCPVQKSWGCPEPVDPVPAPAPVDPVPPDEAPAPE